MASPLSVSLRVAAGVALVVLLPPVVQAADGQMCVRLSQIDQSPAVNSRTILLKMKDKTYKRVDLAGPCSGLMMNGFIHQTSTDDLCKTDTLRVNETVGAVCMIDKIVDITPEEAKALQTKKKK